MLSNILYRILSKGCPNLAVAQDISSCRRICEKKLRPKHHKTCIYAWNTSGISPTRRGERLAQEDQTYYYSPLEAFQDFLAKNCNIANSTPRTEGVFPTREKTIVRHAKLYFPRRSSKQALIRKRRNKNVDGNKFASLQNNASPRLDKV
jgi:hypothetical protein